jgi:excinuclease UvrABC ATPase subunit
MPQEYIELRGARENNLKNISLRIPKRAITIFTGVSGSGKSSIVFDTLAGEAQRLLNETFSMFVRNFLPRYPQPDADAIENLSTAMVVDQRPLGGGSSSTMGTATDIAAVLRLLFSRIGQPHVGRANLFSFNDPGGSCPQCNGLGRALGLNLDLAFDKSKSLNQGAILLPDYAPGSLWTTNILIKSGLFDPDKPLKNFTRDEWQALLYTEGHKVKIAMDGSKPVNFTFDGVATTFTRKYVTRDIKTLSARTQKTQAPFMNDGVCSLCQGARLSQAALACKIDGRNIAELSAMQIDELIPVVRAIKDPRAAPVVKMLVERLQHLVDIGLEYLTLDRPTATLSGGESQRVKIVKYLGGSLVDVMYVFDEPSVGLHPRDVHRLNELLQRLRDKGNTVLVVEHDPDVIKVADHVVDVGPRAGSQGGTIVYEGNYAGLLNADTLTGQWLRKTAPLKEKFRTPTGQLPITHARANNLRDVSVSIPQGVLTVVTGVAGSGKSSLVHQAFMAQHPGAILVDQSAVGVSSRSNPATYTGIMDDLRKAFASSNKVNAALFSFNSKGACENCQGLGAVYVDMGVLGEVKTPCDVCGGARFKDSVLKYKLSGKNISEVLGMTVGQALAHFPKAPVTAKLQALCDVGLEYLGLGQPLSTLSGGECQRIKLASELHKKGSIYVMDEPTTGLHMSDISHLLEVMNRLVDSGNTVIVIEHNLDVIRNADWIIDMGPEGGSKGGKVMFEGTPQQLLKAKHSLTGEYLKKS